MLRQELLDLLLQHEVDVVFTKVDGTMREMRCTLMPSMLPTPVTAANGKEEKPTKENTSVIRVFCTENDKKEWRSFRVDSVISANKRVLL